MDIAEIVLDFLELRACLERDGHAAAFDFNRRACSPALMLTMRCMSEKLSIFSPLIVRTRSPGWKPAAWAALPA